MQFDKTGIRVFAILRHLQEPALDLAWLVIDAPFERAHEHIDAIAVPCV